MNNIRLDVCIAYGVKTQTHVKVPSTHPPEGARFSGVCHGLVNLSAIQIYTDKPLTPAIPVLDSSAPEPFQSGVQLALAFTRGVRVPPTRAFPHITNMTTEALCGPAKGRNSIFCIFPIHRRGAAF